MMIAGDDIFISVLKDGQFSQAQTLPEAVNSKQDDFNAFIDPDEKFIIFSSYKRKDDLGRGDLYFALRKKDHGNQLFILKRYQLRDPRLFTLCQS